MQPCCQKVNIWQICKEIRLRICNLWQFCANMRKEEKRKKISDLLKAHVSGAIYFKSGMCSLLIFWHLHSELGCTQTRDHGATNACKIVYCSLN